MASLNKSLSISASALFLKSISHKKKDAPKLAKRVHPFLINSLREIRFLNRLILRPDAGNGIITTLTPALAIYIDL